MCNFCLPHTSSQGCIAHPFLHRNPEPLSSHKSYASFVTATLQYLAPATLRPIPFWYPSPFIQRHRCWSSSFSSRNPRRIQLRCSVCDTVGQFYLKQLTAVCSCLIQQIIRELTLTRKTSIELCTVLTHNRVLICNTSTDNKLRS